MQLDRKKYTNKEVQTILDAYKTRFENKIVEQNLQISELRKNNELLNAELLKLKEKEELILSVLKRAEQTAIDLEKQSNLEYELEFERLKNFSIAWDEYFNKIKEKYPNSKEISKAKELKNHVNLPGKDYSPKQTIKELEKLAKTLSSNGGRLYLENDVSFAYKDYSFDGFNPRNDAAYSLSGSLCYKSDFDLVELDFKKKK